MNLSWLTDKFSFSPSSISFHRNSTILTYPLEWTLLPKLFLLFIPFALRNWPLTSLFSKSNHPFTFARLPSSAKSLATITANDVRTWVKRKVRGHFSIPFWKGLTISRLAGCIILQSLKCSIARVSSLIRLICLTRFCVLIPHSTEYCRKMSGIFPIFHCNWIIVATFLLNITKYFIATLKFQLSEIFLKTDKYVILLDISEKYFVEMLWFYKLQ